jgi:hypothetical protein
VREDEELEKGGNDEPLLKKDEEIRAGKSKVEDFFPRGRVGSISHRNLPAEISVLVCRCGHF